MGNGPELLQNTPHGNEKRNLTIKFDFAIVFIIETLFH